VQIEAANVGANPFTIAIGETNTVDSPALTMKILAETPRTVWTQCIGGGNHSVVKLSRTATGESLIGRRVRQDSDYFCQVGTFPSVAYLPLLAVGWEPTVLAAPFNAIVTTRYFLDVEFFTLNPQV